MSSLLTVNAISKEFNGSDSSVRALDTVSFSIETGEFVCLLGPSGSGKSTLLRIVAGLLPPSRGRVTFGGREITKPQPDIGFVFQKSNLMPWRTVLQNVLLPLEIDHGATTSEDASRANTLLDLVGLRDFSKAYPAQLSGGMSQRVVLARTLIQQPDLLLMDEPFGALDALTRERLNVELLHIQNIHRSTVLMVTHSISEAVFLSDRVLILSDRPGRLIVEVPVDLPRPRLPSMMGGEHFGRLTTEIRRSLGIKDAFLSPPAA